MVYYLFCRSNFVWWLYTQLCVVNIQHKSECICYDYKILTFPYFLYWILNLEVTIIGAPSLNHCKAGNGVPWMRHINLSSSPNFTAVLFSSPSTLICFTKMKKIFQFTDLFILYFKHVNYFLKNTEFFSRRKQLTEFEQNKDSNLILIICFLSWTQKLENR